MPESLTIIDFPTASALNGTELVLLWKAGSTQNATAALLASLAPPSPVRLVSVTSNYDVLPTDNGTQFDNYGAVGSITFTLPSWQAGLFFSMVVAEPFALSVDPGASTLTLAPFGSLVSLSSQDLFSSVLIGTTGSPGNFFVKSLIGSWDYS